MPRNLLEQPMQPQAFYRAVADDFSAVDGSSRSS
jgi:hypothetical protein